MDGGGGEGREVGIDVPLEQPPQAAQQQQQQPASLLRAEGKFPAASYHTVSCHPLLQMRWVVVSLTVWSL